MQYSPSLHGNVTVLRTMCHLMIPPEVLPLLTIFIVMEYGTSIGMWYGVWNSVHRPESRGQRQDVTSLLTGDSILILVYCTSEAMTYKWSGRIS